MLIQTLARIKDLTKNTLKPNDSLPNQDGINTQITRDFARSLSLGSKSDLNYIPPPDSLKIEYKQNNIFPYRLSRKVKDFVDTYLFEIIGQTFEDPINQNKLENFKIDGSKTELSLDFNENIIGLTQILVKVTLIPVSSNYLANPVSVDILCS